MNLNCCAVIDDLKRAGDVGNVKRLHIALHIFIDIDRGLFFTGFAGFEGFIQFAPMCGALVTSVAPMW